VPESPGVTDDHIFVVMALGSHCPMTEAEIERKVGRAVMKRVADHNSGYGNFGRGFILC